jgi:hypothetical protein
MHLFRVCRNLKDIGQSGGYRLSVGCYFRETHKLAKGPTGEWSGDKQARYRAFANKSRVIFTSPEPETNGISLHKTILSQMGEKTRLGQNPGMVRARGVDQDICLDCAVSSPTLPEMQNKAVRCHFYVFDPCSKNRQ